MAKKSAIERNDKRKRMADQYAEKRAELKAIARDQERPIEERFAAQLKLAELPRNSAPSRIRNRCELTGRPRGYYRKFKMNRIELRNLANSGEIPGITKSSW
ncbi:MULTISPECIES: 30S ribosomal protein S14 [Euryhalocaulis]|uniref:30S ribosomal protein S14 n=1 Tax=Euryhalocaulis TaxID=1712422 RepID=UPI0003AA1F90|nr:MULTISPECIES: 30S ribosomal protein S14 [Euryhalocaulis]MBA4801233.1 30S ribosomal protein S14 [Euryhalocaulis sp.]